MPTEDQKLAAIFRAVLSVSECSLEEFVLRGTPLTPPMKAYRFTVDHPIVLDKMYAEALIPYVRFVTEEDNG